MEFVFALRSVFGIPLGEFKNTIFELYALEGYRSIFARGGQIVNDADLLEILIHDHKSLQCLDLAVKPCSQWNWSRKLKWESIRNLSLACGEYLLAESEIPATRTFGRAFRELDLYHHLLMKNYTHILFTVRKNWFQIYTRIFYERYEGMDGIQRRSAIRKFMNAYSVLQMDAFRPTVYQSMIRDCTSPEPDPSLTIELLRTLCINSKMKIRAFLEAPNESLETMLCHAKAMHFDFWGLWRGIGELSATFNPVADFIFLGKNSGARILLKYGFPYSSEVMNSEKVSRIFGRRLHRVFRRFMSRRMFLRLMGRLRRARLVLILITFMAFEDLDGVRAIPADSIPTLVCLMRCVPEPYVPPAEMRSELEPFFLSSFHQDLERIADRYETAKIFVGEDYTVLKPRKLEHLCRCVIRRAIADNFRLPEGIKELEMCRILRDILLLEF